MRKSIKEAILWQKEMLLEGDTLHCDVYWPKGGTGTITYSLHMDYLDGTDVPEKFHDYLYEEVGRIEIEDIIDGEYTVDVRTGEVIVK